MPEINKNKQELASEIVIAALQSGKVPSYKAEDVLEYYSVIYKGLSRIFNEEYEQNSQVLREEPYE